MNILELLKSTGIDSSNFSELTSEEIIRIEKKINVEKRLNPDLDTNTIVNLLNAIKSKPKELDFVYNHLYFRKIFLNEAHNYKSPNNLENLENKQEIKLFLKDYFINDLENYFENCYAKNDFIAINRLLEYSSILPEELIFTIKRKVLLRLDYAILNLNEFKKGVENNISYIERKSFYDALSNIRSSEIDEKMSNLVNSIIKLSSIRRGDEFLLESIQAMAYYNAIDADLDKVLKSNRDIVYKNESNYIQPSTSSSSTESNYSPFKIVLLAVIIIVKLLFFVSRCSNNNNSYRSSSTSETINNMSNGFSKMAKLEYKKQKEFHYYLTEYDSIITTPILIDTLKTGDKLFSNTDLNDNSTIQDSLHIENKTSFDVILLVNMYLQPVYKLKKAYFIKKGQSLKVENNNMHYKSVYNFYMGRKPAVFKGSQYESYNQDNYTEIIRFMELPEGSSQIIDISATFSNKLIIKEEKGYINAISDEIEVYGSDLQPTKIDTLSFFIN